jgi:pilus assembly protein FimV
MSLPAADKGGEYRIQVYDTLSKIAAKHKPAGDVSIEQTMIAIQRANPQVFIRNNVNLIKSGYVVRLPTADEARAITAAQASQEVDEQIKEWRGGSSSSARSSAAPATGPQLDARAPEPTNKEGGYKEQARLSIATPGNSDKTSTGEGSTASGKGLEALRNQLTASQESLEKGKRDNHELQSRLDDMERQIATLQRLISLKDDQLAALQSKPGADKTAVKETPTAAAATPTPAAPVAPAGEATSAAEQAAVPAAIPTPAPATPTPAPKVTAPAPKPEPGLVEQLTENPLYMGGAALLVLLLGGFAFQRKRQAAAEEREAMSDLTLDDGDSFTLDDSVDFEQVRVADDAITMAGSDEQHIRDEAPQAKQPQAVRSETGDAIAESDIYIAYGRYQQAVDLLSHAIDAEPTRSDLRVKLLEVCLEMRNKDAFRQQFVALQSLGDADAVAHAKDLLSSVDGVSDWLVDLPQTSRSSNVSVGAAATVAAAAAVVAERASEKFETEANFVKPAATPSFVNKADELDLDLDNDLDIDGDLDFDTDIKDEAPTTAATALDDIGEFGLADTDLKADDEEFSFELEDELEIEAPARNVSFDLDSTSIDLPAETTALADSIAPSAELDLDLEHDDLDAALDEMGETGYLNDLEELSDALSDLDKPASATAASFDLGGGDLESSDLGSGDIDLSDEFDLGNVEADLPDIDRLDLAADDELTASFDSAAVTPPIADVPVVDIPSAAPALATTFNETTSYTAAEAASDAAGDEFDFLADADEIATKLDLARAYIDMGDTDGAKDILDEVMQEGTDTQKQEASTLLSRIG